MRNIAHLLLSGAALDQSVLVNSVRGGMKIVMRVSLLLWFVPELKT